MAEESGGAETERRREEWTRFAEALGAGERLSAEELLPGLYDELRALARSRMANEAPGHTLQPTVLVHEAYLRLVGDADPGWNGRGHFFGAAARAMRRILVESARRKERLRHGGAHGRIDGGEVEPEAPPDFAGASAEEVLAVEEALERLEGMDERKGRLVELRWFAGLTVEETAAALGVSVGTVERDWRFVKAWLKEALER